MALSIHLSVCLYVNILVRALPELPFRISSCKFIRICVWSGRRVTTRMSAHPFQVSKLSLLNFSRHFVHAVTQWSLGISSRTFIVMCIRSGHRGRDTYKNDCIHFLIFQVMTLWFFSQTLLFSYLLLHIFSAYSMTQKGRIMSRLRSS